MKEIQNNFIACEELNKEVINILESFEAGYINRDITVIDSYMEKLFAKGDDIVIIGTSIGEWSLGYDAAKELIKSDWEYWGDVRLKMDTAIISDCGDSVWVAVDASIKYQFETNDDKYDRYIDFVKSYLDPNNDNSKLPDKYKTAHINWVLSQVFWNREGERRTYQWPLKISAVLRRYNGRLLFIEMQFCLPPANEVYPDVRLGFDKSMLLDAAEGKKQIKEYLDRTGYKCEGDIELFFSEFTADYLKCDVCSPDIVQRYFLCDNNQYVLSYNHEVYKGTDSIAGFIAEQRSKWNSMNIEKENTILRVYDDTALLAAWGVLSNSIDEDKAVKLLLDDMRYILEKDCKSNDKLFQIQRRIALMLKETASGEQLDCCFKLEAILVRNKNQWKFSKLQFSFPFYYFIEGMYNVPAIG